MSVWSAIDLADRNAIEKLAEQVENLRIENRELLAENQRLVSAQLGEKYTGLYAAENQSTQFLAKKIAESHKDLSAQIESALRMIYDLVASEGETTRGRVSSAKKLLQEEIQRELKSGCSQTSEEIRNAAEHLEHAVTAEADSLRKKAAQIDRQTGEQLAAVIRNQETARDFAASSLEELNRDVSSRHSDIREMISQSLHQILEQQEQTLEKGCSAIADANRSLILRMEEYCTSALEEVKSVADRYRQIEQDGQENLDRIRELSSEMLELGEHQKKVMEQLSRLCQDADQFMEIQKSINDIWEIMKAVWVDSLLGTYEKELNKGSGQ